MGLIDAHVHLWTPDTAHYPLAPGSKKEDMRSASFTPEELFKHAKPAGVDRVNLIQTRGFRVKEEAATTVRHIFQMARDGLGVHRITERLTREKVPPLGTTTRWINAYVYRILTNPAAMGTYQPNRQEKKKVVPDGEPIPGYYPVVVTEEEWREAQRGIEGRGGDFDEKGRFQKGGRASSAAGRKGKDDREANLFTGLIHSAVNGERMHLVHRLGRKGKGERKRDVYLCPTRETGVPEGGPKAAPSPRLPQVDRRRTTRA